MKAAFFAALMLAQPKKTRPQLVMRQHLKLLVKTRKVLAVLALVLSGRKINRTL